MLAGCWGQDVLWWDRAWGGRGGDVGTASAGVLCLPRGRGGSERWADGGREGATEHPGLCFPGQLRLLLPLYEPNASLWVRGCACSSPLLLRGGHFGRALPLSLSEHPHTLLGGSGCCPAGCLALLPNASLRGMWLPQNEVGPPQKRSPGVKEIPVGTAKATHRTTGMAGDIVVGFRVISGERSSVGAQCLPAPPALPPAG